MTLPPDFDDWLFLHDPEPPDLTGEQILALAGEPRRPAPPQPARPAPIHQTSWEQDDDY